MERKAQRREVFAEADQVQRAHRTFGCFGFVQKNDRERGSSSGELGIPHHTRRRVSRQPQKLNKL
jgi:hypothetical protein